MARHSADGLLAGLAPQHPVSVATIQVYRWNSGYDWHPQSISDG